MSSTNKVRKRKDDATTTTIKGRNNNAKTTKDRNPSKTFYYSDITPIQPATSQTSTSKQTTSQTKQKKNVKSDSTKTLYETKLSSLKEQVDPYAEYSKKWTKKLELYKAVFDVKWAGVKKHHLPLNDFKVVKGIGEGSYGKVLLVKQKAVDKYYALKMLDKGEIEKRNQTDHVINEKKILSAIKFRFLVHMKFSVETKTRWYLFLEYVNGGEMFYHLSEMVRFDEEQTKFYAAQVILALEYLHSLQIIHRDIKPENILITSNGYIKVTDFGFAKMLTKRTYTFCGTPEYLAPEVVKVNGGYGFSVDWWAIGILTYEMAAGQPPFNRDDYNLLYENILTKEISELKPFEKFSTNLKDFITCMTQKDPTRRYGVIYGGVDRIKKHKWFSNLNWWNLYERKINPPFIPKVSGPGDTRHFPTNIDF